MNCSFCSPDFSEALQKISFVCTFVSSCIQKRTNPESVNTFASVFRRWLDFTLLLKHHRCLTPTLFLQEPQWDISAWVQIWGGLEPHGMHHICHIRFYKDRKTLSSQVRSRGLIDFFFFKRMIKHCLITLAIQTIPCLWWLRVWKDSWNELFCSFISSMNELDLCRVREIWLIGILKKGSWAQSTLAVTCSREFGCTVGKWHTPSCYCCVTPQNNCLMLTEGNGEALVLDVRFMLHS